MRSDARGIGTGLRIGRSAASSLLLLAIAGCCLITEGTSQQVTFVSEPQGAKFTVGEQEYTTPVAITLPKEEHQLRFSLPGYQDLDYELKCRMSSSFYWSWAMGLIATSIDWLTGAWREFDVGEDGKVSVALNKLPAFERRPVVVSSVPPGAQIIVGNVVHGRTNTRVELIWSQKEETKDVTLRLPEYEDLPLVLKRRDDKLSGKLTAKPMIVPTLFESDPPGARVRVGDAVYPTAQSVNLTWFVSSPPREAVFVLDGYQDETKKFTRGDTLVKATLKEIVRSISREVTSDPDGAYVDVDGKPAGRTPGAVTLTWSVSQKQHKLTLWRPGYRAEEVQVAEGDTPKAIHLQVHLPLLP